MTGIRKELESEVRQLDESSNKLPYSVEEMLSAGRVLLQLEDGLLEREWERYGKAPALVFIAQYAIGRTPRELNVEVKR